MNNPMIDEHGNKYWYRKEQLHRENGPAIEYVSGEKYWYLNDKFHREDGPAVDCIGYKRWYYHGELIHCSSQEQFERIIKLKIFL